MYHTVEMLVVDDNPGDVRLFQEFFRTHKFANQVSYVSDSEQMLHFLRRESPYQQAPVPDVILLNIRPFLLEGWQCLRDLHQQARLHQIPLIGLTGADGEESALQEAAALFTGYVVKPLDMSQLRAMLAKIDHLGLVITKESHAQPRDVLA